MIPIKDSPRARRFPLVNVGLIVANALVFWLELTMAPARLDGFIHRFGIVPSRLWAVDFSSFWEVGAATVPVLTSMFIHGGWVHFLGNMLFLWIFGDNVEDRLGHIGYAVFYLLGGAAAAAAHVVLGGPTTVPTIGASGAIAGVMGAYLILYPRARVVTLLPVFFYAYFIEIPAWFYLGVWLLLQLFSGALSLGAASAGGVAWWAHLGGFVAGVVLILIFPKCREHRYPVGP